ncbi:hypothetical protein GIB67_014119 [Kingdonia uniflora]|uniref:Cytochrome b561 and DOMON domain-containing protein n=1 Tax=Kingdonia uniflora TaxID=39325 RepID=A0A7J7N468_9MAGN|nr:hypothetical protein GIB67_014119 [Kingdonia uniflora]
MSKFYRPCLVVFVLVSLVFSSSAQTCKNQVFKSNKGFTACNDLPVLNSFLHWTYEASNRTVDLAFRYSGTTASKWVVYALNPSSTGGMIGAQSLVAFEQENGVVKAYTSSVTGFDTTLAEGNLSFRVPSLSAEITSTEITIYATLVLPGTSTKINHVWQEGPVQTGNVLSMHTQDTAHTTSMGNIDFQSGVSSSSGGTDSKQKRKNAHGVLNAVSWGTLMPIGAMIARYLRVFKSANPAWFYLHASWQTAAYVIGTAGWITGLKLGNESKGITHSTHRNVGITLFVLAMLQIFALLLRPKPDHKYRLYWNIYHHVTGYTVLFLSVFNVYEGFDILDPEKKWKRIYTGVLITIASIAVVLEALTWIIVIRRKKAAKSQSGANGVNGYGSARL